MDLNFGNDATRQRTETSSPLESPHMLREVGYLPDGTPMNRAGNCINHPESIGPDPHVPGSPLPRALFVNDIGYLPDGTPMNRAGNAINHPDAGPLPARKTGRRQQGTRKTSQKRPNSLSGGSQGRC